MCVVFLNQLSNATRTFKPLV